MGLVQRLGIIAAGHATKEGADSLFDYFIYPAVTAGCVLLVSFLCGSENALLWGSALSICIMVPITGIINYAYLKVYDRVGVDALGAELLKRIRHIRARGLLGLVVNPIIWLIDWTLVLLIACFEDSFVATVYARKGVEQYNGLSKRDWVIFVLTTVISNVFWVFLASTAYVLLSMAWSYVYDRIPEPYQGYVDSVVEMVSSLAGSLGSLIAELLGK